MGKFKANTKTKFKANVKPKEESKFKANINYRPKFKANIKPKDPIDTPTGPPKKTFKANIVPNTKPDIETITKPIVADIAAIKQTLPSETNQSFITIGKETFFIRRYKDQSPMAPPTLWYSARDDETPLSFNTLFTQIDAALGTSIFRSKKNIVPERAYALSPFLSVTQYFKLIAYFNVANTPSSDLKWRSEQLDALFLIAAQTDAISIHKLIYSSYADAIQHFGLSSLPSQYMHLFGQLPRNTISSKLLPPNYASAAYPYTCTYTSTAASFSFTTDSSLYKRYLAAANKMEEIVLMAKKKLSHLDIIARAKKYFYFYNRQYIKMPSGSDTLLTQALQDCLANAFSDIESTYPFAHISLELPPKEFINITLPYHDIDPGFAPRTSEKLIPIIQTIARSSLPQTPNTVLRRKDFIDIGLTAHEFNTLRDLSLVIAAEHEVIRHDRYGNQSISIEVWYGHYTMSTKLLTLLSTERRKDE